MCSIDVGHFSKTAASDMTKAARAKFDLGRTGRLSRSTEALPSSAAEASSDDIQSRRTSVQVRLFSSARQPSRSVQQSEASQASQQQVSVSGGGRRRRSKRRPKSQSQSVVVDIADEQSVSSDTSRDTASTTVDSQSSVSQSTASASATATCRQPLTGLQSRAAVSSVSSSSHCALPHRTMQQARHADSVTSSSTVTQHQSASRSASDHTARNYRAAAVTVAMPFSSTTGRNVHVSDDRKTVSRKPGDFCNAYVFTQQPLLPGEELVLRITGTNMDYVGGLTVGLSACDPATLKVTDLPDDADMLLDRPEYWVVCKNICSHPKVNDELAFLRTVSGKSLFVIAEDETSDICLATFFELKDCVHSLMIVLL